MTKPQGSLPRDPFSIEDDRAFLSALNTAVWKAMDASDLFQGLPNLNSHERTFICLDIFLTEVEADGLSHFFYYDCGALWQDVLLGLDEIGARGLKARLERCIAQVFRGQVPVEMHARQAILDAMESESHPAEAEPADLGSDIARLAAWARTNQRHFRRTEG